MPIKESLKKFWTFLKADTWQSWIVSLVLLIVLIKFILFPILILATGSSLPLVIVESCSMYHESNLDEWWSKNSAWYESRNITKEEFESFPIKNGLNKGDILLITKSEEYHKGDIIVFNAGSTYPLIHRIVEENPIGTKGDHNSDQIKSSTNSVGIDETSIPEDKIIGKASVKLMPLLGWAKLIFYEPMKTPSQRGFCK